MSHSQSRPESSRRRVIILGSTGSIGRSTVEVIEHLRQQGWHFDVVALAAKSNASELHSQQERLGVRETALELRDGAGAALRLVERVARPGDLVVGAMVGAAGIAPTVAAIERGCDIALANKETLVAAGSLVTAAARRTGVQLLAVDSEHSALAQCLRTGRSISEVRRVVLTASGGPFRRSSAAAMARATPEAALRHPTWTMGRKVTIDSATMMNKALEVIEAHWLFGLEAERIAVLVHPQSIVHSLVEFIDGSVVAQLSPPDMRLPIQLALTWPERAEGCARRIDWATLRTLEFESVDLVRFPAVSLAAEVIQSGGTAGAILNAANEVAVEAFLSGRLPFMEIPAIVAAALASIPRQGATSLEQVMQADAAARAWVGDRIAACARQTANSPHDR